MAAARLPSFAGTRIHPGLLFGLRLPRALRRGDDPHALGPRDASDRRQCRSEPAPRHSRFADHDRRDDAGGRNGGRGRHGRGFRDPGAAGRGFVAGLRLHGLSRRLAGRWRRDRHRRHGVPVRRRQLRRRHPADHPGDALRRHQSPDGVGAVHRARAAQSDGAPDEHVLRRGRSVEFRRFGHLAALRRLGRTGRRARRRRQSRTRRLDADRRGGGVRRRLGVRKPLSRRRRRRARRHCSPT